MHALIEVITAIVGGAIGGYLVLIMWALTRRDWRDADRIMRDR